MTEKTEQIAELWDHYQLVLKVPRIAGGLPADPKLMEAWQRANWPANPAKTLKPEDPATPEEAAARSLALIAEKGEAEEVEPELPRSGWTTFARDKDNRLCIEGRLVKSMLKEAANIMKDLPVVKTALGRDKATMLRARLAERVFVIADLGLTPSMAALADAKNDPLLPLSDRTGPDEVLERPIHVMTRQGPRDALTRTDIVHDAEITCTLRVLKDGMFTEPVLKLLLTYASDNGLGADRSQGFGRFDYVLRAVTPR